MSRLGNAIFQELIKYLFMKCKGNSQTKRILVSITENSLPQAAQDSISTHTSSTQSVTLVRERMGRDPFLYPAEIL